MADIQTTHTEVAARVGGSESPECTSKASPIFHCHLDDSFCKLLENSAEAILLLDANGSYLYSSPSVQRILGYQPHELDRRSGFELCHPDEIEMVARAFSDLVQGPVATVRRVLRCRCKGGSYRRMEVVATNHLETPSVNAIVVNCRDVTERWEQERAVRESERRLRSIIDSCFGFIGLIDPDGNLIEVNRSALDVAGLDRADVTHRPLWELYWFSYCEEIQTQLKRALQEVISGETVRFETLARVRNDGRIVIDLEFRPMRDECGCVSGIFGFAVDVTERHEAEQQMDQLRRQLAHAGRVSTMGETAAGIAHELNQPLAAISLYAEGCLSAVDRGSATPDDITPKLREIARLGMHCGQLIERLKRFASRRESPHVPLDLRESIETVVAFSEPELRSTGIACHVALPDRPLTIIGDMVELQQLLLNLVRNAIEAHDETAVAPQIEIVARRCEPDGVEVRVTDRGRGIEATDLDQLYDPFFTTKPDGMGMGLKISQTIVSSHGGTIRCSTSPGTGSTFTVTFPQRDTAAHE